MLPACLRLDLPVCTFPGARATAAQRHVAQPSQRHVHWRTRAVAQAAAAREAPPPASGQRPRPTDALSPRQGQTFDDFVRSGRLDDALQVLGVAAAALPPNEPIPLLGPTRNRALIQACFNARRADRALDYLQLLHPAVAPWPAVLKEANRRRDLRTLQRVLAARDAAGLPLDHRCATAVISGYSASGRLPDALAAFCRAWEAHECRTVEVANAAISACANQGNWQAAQEVVAIMAREGVAPDTITYNSLLKAAAACGLLPEARRLYAEMRAARLQPSTFTYAALFNAAARARAGDADWLLETFDEMVAAGVRPNDYVVSALFAAASYAPCTPAQLDRLFAALALLRSHGPPNDQVYTALLTLIQRQALQERAVDVWTAIKADGVRQSPHLLSALFAACTTDAPSPALVDTAVEAARAAQGAWRAAAARGAPSAWAERDWLVAFNALLHFLGSVRALPRALAVYRGMVRSGPTPDTITYNTLLAAAAQGGGNVRAAMQVFSDMVDAEVEPTERTAGALLHCYAKARDAASARKVFDSMAQLGIRPNLKTYTSLIDACVAAGEPRWTQLAFELLGQMRAAGLAPSAVTYGCLLAACERGGDVERAFALYKQACDEGVVPSDRMHDMLISLCTQEQRLEEAVDLVKRLARRPPSVAAAGGGGNASTAGSPGSPRAAAAAAGGAGGSGGASTGATTSGGLQEHTLNSLVRALCGKYIDRALRMLSLCQTMGLRTSRATYLALVAGCARASRSAAAYDLYRSLRAQGMDADGATASALISSLCQANQLDLAETVYNDMLALAWRREMEALPAPAARRGGLSHRALLPDAEATASLVQGFAAAGELRSAGKYYKQLRRSSAKALAAVTVSHRRMWELLIESNCRQGKVKQALQVFDDWKAAADAWVAAQQQHEPFTDLLADPTAAGSPSAASASGADGAPGGEQAPPEAQQQQAEREREREQAEAQAEAQAAPPSGAVYPKLSLVALAFLEACCRDDPRTEWRVYDVCAQMRRQKEQKRQGSLPRPQKASHHVAPA